MINKILLLGLCFIFLFSGCSLSHYNSSQTDSQVNKTELNLNKKSSPASSSSQKGGTTLGLMDKTTAVSNINRTFQLKKGGNFTPKFFCITEI